MKRASLHQNMMNKMIKEEIDMNTCYVRKLYDEPDNARLEYFFSNEISNRILQNNYKQICQKYVDEEDINKRLKTCYNIISKLDINLQNTGWQVIYVYENKDIYYYHNSQTNETKKIHWSYLNY